MSPDVDITKFSEKMVESLQKLKTRIPRCEKAFAKIAKSVNLLQDNFSDYYKDFLVAQNPNVILENFISDVSVSSKADPDTIRQFRTIIEHCRSNFMGNNKDPKIEKIFEVLNTNMEILEKKVKPQQSGSSESAESE
jgi:flagellar biosynthesis chaperone FliJ